MSLDLERLIADGSQGRAAAIARLMTFATQDPVRATDAAASLPAVSPALKIGVTGPPGVGKSCLLSALITYLRARSKRVGVLCIDPSSPLTGGAVLGDRIRMSAHALDPGVFIRSFGSRGRLGGLAAAVPPAVRLLEACEIDVVIVETVGVGQNEIEVAYELPTSVLVLSPATGDSIQAIKGGVLEMASVIVVNKADLPGADLVVKELRQSLGPTPSGWVPPVVKVIATDGTGVEQLWAAVEEHRAFRADAGDALPAKERLLRALLARVEIAVRARLGSADGDDLADRITGGATSMSDGVAELLESTPALPTTRRRL